MKIIFELESDSAYQTIMKAGIIITGTHKEKNQRLHLGEKSIGMPDVMRFYHQIYKHFDILIVPYNQKCFSASFKGRLDGAIGINYKISTKIFGKCIEDATHNLYIKYEHISNLKIRESNN